MRELRLASAALLLAVSSWALAGESVFTAAPSASKNGDSWTIAFAVAQKTDVEVAVLNAKGDVVRHLAAGVLGGEKDPPEPLAAGLAQKIAWDGKDNFGKLAAGGPFKARVRAGLGVKFGQLIGADPYNFGSIDSLVSDEDGNVYISGARGESNQMAMCVREFDPEGRYLRELVPFPADLPPDAMKEIARWDAERKTFCPRNLRNLNPDFYGQAGGYWGNAALTLLSVSKKNGVIMTDGTRLYTLDPSGAVRGSKFVSRDLGGAKNSGGGPNFVAISPDGKWVYLSGPYSNTNSYGYKFDPNFPPGRVYRAPLEGTEKFKEFTTVAVEHKDGNGGAWFKACTNTGNFTCPKGSVHGVAVDAKGNVYVADRERGCVAVFDEAGKELGKVAIKNPHLVAVHPKTGAIYVTQFDCLSYGNFQCVLSKFENFKEGAQVVAKIEFLPGNGANSNTSMVLSVGKDKTIVWMGGVKGGLVPIEDKGSAFEQLPSQFAEKENIPRDWYRLAVDYDRDELYISNGTNRFWRYNGLTGEGDLLKKDGKLFNGTDLAVGYDGLLYVRTGNGYSGPLERLNHELAPAPYANSGSHVLSPYIYSRMGCGYAERGLGVGPDGKCYITFMYDWVAYAVGGFGSDGKPLKGKYLDGIFPAKKPEGKKSYPAGLDSAIIGPVPQMTANIRVDLKGNLYLGMMYRSKDFAAPKGFEKDQGYRVSVGSVVKFGPEGGTMPGPEGSTSAAKLEGVLNAYPGIAPFSSSAEAFGGNTCCVCRVPRFDLDRYGRLAIPNAMTNTVLLYDNAGNLILEFGKYGNFDSQFVNPNTDTGKQKKPTVAAPEIPMGWPTGAGFSENHVYVNDTYNRRAMRLDKTFSAEQNVDLK
ncbi:MAG: SMP-30/gluconolactonase/LRE family protein [Planctomycetes bacterium]|nr:SMP-30/gluconolactonase/LRE family protein [Planctomycetota bacterium]